MAQPFLQETESYRATAISRQHLYVQSVEPDHTMDTAVMIWMMGLKNAMGEM